MGLVATHALAVFALTVGVTRSLYRSFRALGPAQDTRERRAQRWTLVPVFVLLALLSLSTAGYASVQHAIVSYKTWASERDVQVPARYVYVAFSHPPVTRCILVLLSNGQRLTQILRRQGYFAL